MSFANAMRPRPREKFTLRGWAAALTTMATAMLSAQSLIALHDNYAFGGVLEKMHPATYLGAVFVGLQTLLPGRERLFAVFRENRGAILLPVSVIILAIYVLAFLATPATVLIDTWVLAVAIFVLCAQLNALETAVLRNLLSFWLVLNALVGIGEVIANKHVVPLAVGVSALGAYSYPMEWRAGAFLGLPLSNAYLTACFLLLLLLDHRIKTFCLRLPALAICGISLLAFGSRAAIALLAPVLIAALAWQVARSLLRGRIAKDLLIYLYGSLFAAVTGLPILLATGFADRFIARFTLDNGSASARSGAMEMAANLPLSQWITGIPHLEMLQMGARFGVGAAIENFWLSFMLSYGLIGYLIFMPSLFLFCRDLVRKGGPAATPVLIYFFLLCSTSVSLASKNLMFAILTGLLATNRNEIAIRIGRAAARSALGAPQPRMSS